jgi:hypothetical protein
LLFYEALLLKKLVRLFGIYVALSVLKLHFLFRPEFSLHGVLLQFLPQFNGIGYFSDFVKVAGVGDSEAPHTVGVPPFLEVPLKCPASPVGLVAAYFAFVFDTEAVQFVEPIGDRLAVPAHRIVLLANDNFLLLFLFFWLYIGAFFLLQLRKNFSGGAALLLFNVQFCVFELFAKKIGETINLVFLQ